MRFALFYPLLLLAHLVAPAAQDSLAQPTFIHTKHVLPEPWKSGEIIAEADYGGEQGIARYRSLTIKVGSDTITVPQKILDFFPAPRVTSLELFYGPPPEPGADEPRYLNVTFRFWSRPYEGISYPGEYPRAWIIIEGGRIKQLTKIEPTSDTVTTYTDYDPATLKEGETTTVTRAQ